MFFFNNSAHDPILGSCSFFPMGYLPYSETTSRIMTPFGLPMMGQTRLPNFNHSLHIQPMLALLFYYSCRSLCLCKFIRVIHPLQIEAAYVPLTAVFTWNRAFRRGQKDQPKTHLLLSIHIASTIIHNDICSDMKANIIDATPIVLRTCPLLCPRPLNMHRFCLPTHGLRLWRWSLKCL